MKRLSEIRDFNSYLNTENDRTIPARSPEPTHFNSRSLCRKRQLFVSVKVWYPIFQSTFPMQGTTSMRLISKTICLQFQSTFPMQGTTSDMQRLLRHKQFQSTFPMQGTTILGIKASSHPYLISIHVPNAGNDSKHIQISILNNTIFVTYYGFLLISFPL